MKIKQIEEIATKKVSLWKAGLLIFLLALGYFAVPFLSVKSPLPLEQKPHSMGIALGSTDIKNQLSSRVSSMVKPISQKLQKDAEAVLGIAQHAVQQTVQNIASQSANQAKEFVLDNTLGKILQNINTLPQDQQDLIKKAICK